MEEKLFGENMNNRRIGRSELRKACFKRRNIRMMREDMQFQRKGLIEDKLHSYFFEVIHSEDAELCFYFLQEFKDELTAAEIGQLETVIMNSQNKEVIEFYNKSKPTSEEEQG